MDDDSLPVSDGITRTRRSVAATLGQVRFHKAPGKLNAEQMEALDRAIEDAAIGDVLQLLQGKTSEAYVVPWYNRVKRGWTYMLDGQLCELHAIKYAKGKEPQLTVRLLERDTVAAKIIELRESDVPRLIVFKRPKPTETHTTPTWDQYVEATKASDGPGSHCSTCFKRLDREPCSKYIDVMPVLHLCDECREQPRKSSHSILLASLGPRRQVRVHLPCSYLRLSYDVWHHYEHATTVCGVIARLSVMRPTGDPTHNIPVWHRFERTRCSARVRPTW